MRISAWAIRNPIPVVSLFILLTIAGIVAYVGLPIKQFPNVNFPVVSVTVTQNGAAPSEVENQITRPIENALSSVAGVKHISSTAVLGSSTTTVEFELHSDMQKATDDVRTAVERARIDLPPGIDPPLVQRLDIDSAPILTYAVSAPGMGDTELSRFIDKVATRALQAQAGVAQVHRIGGADREINIVLDAQRMAALGVTAPQVNNALAAFHSDDPGGRADVGAVEQTIRVLGSSMTIDRLRELAIPVQGRYVRLADIAEIGDGSAEQRGFARLDGRPVTAIQVSKTREASDISVEDRAIKVIAQLQADHPGVTFTKLVSTVDSTRRTFASTQHVLIEGIFLAVIVVYIFLRNWRATIIAAVAMPLSLIPTFVLMSAMGFSLNSITLLALTLVIGILVDDAIVEVENIEKRIETGETPYRAALIGADAIGLAVIATTATIIAVFAPVSLIPGQAGQFFREFGLTVAVAVLFSLVVARLLTPLMAAYFLVPLKDRAHREKRPVNPIYGRILDWALAHRWKTMGIGAGIFALSLLLASFAPVGFQPVGNPGYLYIAVQGPPGATRDDMARAVNDATRMLSAEPAVERVFAQVGSTSGGFSAGDDMRTGTLTVVLKHDRDVTTDEFRSIIRPKLRDIPDVRLSNQGTFGSASVNIVLAGEDGQALERTQTELLRQMRKVPSISDPRPAPPPAGPELIVTPRAEEAARLNVDSRTLAQVLRIATIGDIDASVAKYSDGDERVPIRVRLPEGARKDLDTIANLRVPTLDGQTTPLSAVADIQFKAGPGKIVRYDRERRVSVEADLVAGRTLGQALQEVAALPVMRNLPQGVQEAKVGDSEAMSELFGGFMLAIVAGIGLTFSVLVLLFKGFFKPAVILAALPLSLLGAFAALVLFGKTLDLPAMIGLLMLLGLCAKNSILLVEFAIEEERAGTPMTQALRNACRERARPIVMTTVAMAAGMLPTALGIGEGAEFRQPMALAVIGGLITSTALSLIFVPVIYEIVDSIERWIAPRAARLVTPRQAGDDDPFPT
ncbi:efflux RND transporter permease subunit [Sphingomonadales bacterium 56]|uniref:efflux RND transporter permease subunit n=1 Tax=unclassified Sphingobium TaxID=2611147 RepID=UPI00191ADD32|nr:MULTISPECIES: efflux RND transporter permease subunit [unclassified Sphingobium]MBY2929689.1 efflux RND transporter permease subunit [Sphingomonadales bacterium 56]MBY2960128.1 efflux RND transporter permease subunit [Sphingomonadales bacterium 58]CAD7339997.1 Multidrug resistance protein MdtB [Sphingobium sp. S6]CAD7340427.1 Multidrug resistance protein MdtB [Sphingobium sp. S8]